MPQNQIYPQAGLTNAINNPVGNNISMRRWPQMRIIQNPRYQIHANFRPEVTEITNKLAEDIREAMWDCQRSGIYTQAAFESNIQKHLKNVPKVTVVSYGMIEKIDQYGNPWEEWMDGKSTVNNIETLLQPPWLNPISNSSTTDVTFVPLETKEPDNSEPEKKAWYESAWDGAKNIASSAWDTVSSKEFIDKAVQIGGTVLVAAALGTAIVATAGAAGAFAGAAAGAAVTSLGGATALAGSAALAGAATTATTVVTTATTVGGYAIAAGIGVDAVNSSIALGTGTNYIAKGAYNLFGDKNQTEEDYVNKYGVGREMLYFAGYSVATLGAYAAANGYSSQKSLQGASGAKTIKTTPAEEVNSWWKNEKGYSNPPYKPGTAVKEIQLAENSKFVRVYDGEISKMYGGWVMKAEDIKGLTPQQIQNKYALPSVPKYICDVEIPSGTSIRTGIANEVTSWGSGGGTQYDLMGQTVGKFGNQRPLK